MRVTPQGLGVVRSVRAAGTVLAHFGVVHGPTVAKVGYILPRFARVLAVHAHVWVVWIERHVRGSLTVAAAPSHHVLSIRAALAACTRVRVVESEAGFERRARGSLGHVRSRRQAAVAVGARCAAVLGQEVHVVVAIVRTDGAVVHS